MSALRISDKSGRSAGTAVAKTDGATHGLPRTGVVLIGTTATVRAVAGQMAMWRETVVPVGCVLANRFDAARDTTRGTGLGILPPLLGFTDDLIGLHAKFAFKAAVVCLPASSGREIRRVRALLNQLGITEKFVPTFEDLLTGAAAGAAIAKPAVDVSGLIGRTGWGVDRRSVSKILKGKRVMITGAGGSIGSELARVVASFGPASVLLMERAENALFDIDAQLARRFPSIARKAILNDVTDAAATQRVMNECKPHVVFHAAAHKHVPLMEDHPGHALSNNLFGTRSIADAAMQAGVERFVMISSDKAVNPTSVMGATKRLAEMYICDLARRPGANTRFSMVRFGNVLASACSVVPIWSQQLAEGHPITVTDPRMTRYFMTIPEAATLVVQAAALEQPVGAAPVYVLDMGEPIQILEMARRFLRQHGLEASIKEETVPAAAREAGFTLPSDEDLIDAAAHPIVFSGARPGEKLYEELAYSAEMLNPTAHPAINRWAPSAVADTAGMIAELDSLRAASADKAKVIEALRRYVPEMKREG